MRNKKAPVIQAGAGICPWMGTGLEWSIIPDLKQRPQNQLLFGGDFHQFQGVEIPPCRNEIGRNIGDKVGINSPTNCGELSAFIGDNARFKWFMVAR